MMDLSFMKTDTFSEKKEYAFYPQYAAVTEREFLEEILLENPENYISITTFNDVDFSKEGKYEVIVGLQHVETKKSTMRLISLIVQSSTLGESLLKNGYWRSYGFILEGHLHKTTLALKNKKDVVYSGILINTFNQEAHRFEARAQNWFNPFKFDSYQLLISNGILEGLEVGEYRLQIEALEKSSGARVISEVIEHKRRYSETTSFGLNTITKEIESKLLGDNVIHWKTKANGEVCMIVSTAL